LKPNLDPFLPACYRPIALSSILGKLFQKILNKRLLWYLESNNLLSLYQYVFRRGRNTTEALLIYNQKNNDSQYSVFFDVHEAFSRVWGYHIVNKLYELGLRGDLPNILQSFLNDRKSMVRIQNITSSPLPGEVFSVLLLVVINGITKCVKFPLTQHLSADDYSVSVRSSNLLRAQDSYNKHSTPLPRRLWKKVLDFPPSNPT